MLLALSSSRRELVEAVDMCRLAMERGARFELGIRPHPEFAVKLLPDSLREWAGRNARDFSGTSLAANLEWCDCVAYVSSTVALEALGRGRPVINLRISDVLDPDPLLDPLALHWVADGPDALAAAMRAAFELDAAAYESRREEALDYIARYFGEPDAKALDAFVPA